MCIQSRPIHRWKWPIVAVLLTASGCGGSMPDSADDRRVQNNLRLIGIAFRQFYEENEHFPYAGSSPAPPVAEELDVKKTHWRVALLPYLKEESLYRLLGKRGQYWKDP